MCDHAVSQIRLYGFHGDTDTDGDESFNKLIKKDMEQTSSRNDFHNQNLARRIEQDTMRHFPSVAEDPVESCTPYHKRWKFIGENNGRSRKVCSGNELNQVLIEEFSSIVNFMPSLLESDGPALDPMIRTIADQVRQVLLLDQNSDKNIEIYTMVERNGRRWRCVSRDALTNANASLGKYFAKIDALPVARLSVPNAVAACLSLLAIKVCNKNVVLHVPLEVDVPAVNKVYQDSKMAFADLKETLGLSEEPVDFFRGFSLVDFASARLTKVSMTPAEELCSTWAVSAAVSVKAPESDLTSSCKFTLFSDGLNSVAATSRGGCWSLPLWPAKKWVTKVGT
jgi:hypothetical protein